MGKSTGGTASVSTISVKATYEGALRGSLARQEEESEA